MNDRRRYMETQGLYGRRRRGPHTRGWQRKKKKREIVRELVKRSLRTPWTSAGRGSNLQRRPLVRTTWRATTLATERKNNTKIISFALPTDPPQIRYDQSVQKTKSPEWEGLRKSTACRVYREVGGGVIVRMNRDKTNQLKKKQPIIN